MKLHAECGGMCATWDLIIAETSRREEQPSRGEGRKSGRHAREVRNGCRRTNRDASSQTAGSGIFRGVAAFSAFFRDLDETVVFGDTWQRQRKGCVSRCGIRTVDTERSGLRSDRQGAPV